MKLLYFGIAIPKEYDNPNWSHAFRDWLQSVEFEYETGKLSIDSMLLEYEFFDSQVRDISNKLRAYCRKHYKKDYYLLRNVPGIGGSLPAEY